MKVAIITISDGCFRGTRVDASGRVLKEAIKAAGWEVISHELLPDELDVLAARFREVCDQQKPQLLVTTGGTGLGPRDVTPEATSMVADRLVPGLAELMRMEGLKKTPRAALSRSLAAIRKQTLILNLPGSPKGAQESFEAVLSLLPHAVEIIDGGGH
ncbi:MAG TPA: MogA/MoaB family molybdenum cofactor biosynthesis protein [Acidobacteriota bacterium]|jgi:molybdenum cofactor synthesis domain-containing protein|nr:MogA/MoaB family molybdenum cofactor biosynthesis protein [Acidobacteriota bacterium]